MTRHVIGAIVLLAASGCPAHQKMLDGIVGQSGDLPCFTVPIEGIEGFGTLRVAAIEVSEITEKGAVVSIPWSVGMKGTMPATVLAPSKCIAYGAIGGQSVAAPLMEGKRYALFINGHVGPLNQGQNRRYSGYFCVIKSGIEEQLVRQVKWDRRARVWDWGVCGTLRSSPREDLKS